jgi:hypothetical protein
VAEGTKNSETIHVGIFAGIRRNTVGTGANFRARHSAGIFEVLLETLEGVIGLNANE